MTREIKFRGKRLDNGEWVYGDLLKEIGTYIRPQGEINVHCNHEELSKCAFAVRGFEVIPETVGQFTGLRDKNGKEAYEGDIVKYTDMNSAKCIETVKWDSKRFLYCAGYTLFDLPKELEVIGTIHDNPELLEAK